MELTQSQLKKHLHYDKNTGIFIRITNRGCQTKIGDKAGHTCKISGYVSIRLLGKRYVAHRLAWLYEYGEFPKEHIDHQNHIRNDNRIINLKEASSKDNNRNRSIDNRNNSGFVGVSWRSDRNTWRAFINLNNKYLSLGNFKDKNEAICARLHANRLYKFHPNHGKKLI